MKSNTMKKATLMIAISMSSAMLSPLTALAADATVHVAGRPVFDVLAGAGGISAISRAEIMQKNLDNALVSTYARGAAAVNVSYKNGMPVLSVGGHYVGTVDNASAKAAKTTPALLANRWANSIRTALADSESIEAYVAQLSGGERTQAAVTATNPYPTMEPARPMYAHMPAGLTFPVVLSTSISSETARAGDVVEARIDQPIALGEFTIPQGSVVSGRVIDSEPGKRLLARKGALEVAFNELRLSNGQSVPINATVSGGLTATQNAGIVGRVNANPLGKTVVQGTVGAGLGAALGTAIGAIAGSHGEKGRAIGRGAWSGAAIGGGVGAAHALLLSKGAHVVIPSGQRLTLQLQAPSQVAVTNTVTGAF